MDVDEEQCLGEALGDVPEQPADYYCNARKSDDGAFAGYCGARAGKGTDHVGEGRCSNHGGNAGAPEDNTNAVTHALYVETNRFYQEVIGEELQKLCIEIFEDYLEQYQDIHGDPPKGHEARLFDISVNHIKIIYGDNWAVDRPDAVDSGNPIVDREEKQTKYGRRITYSESVVVSTQQKLRREDRAWLKDMGLLDDPESQKADAISDLKEAWKESAQDGTHD